jgi:hypothetical protein
MLNRREKEWSALEDDLRTFLFFDSPSVGNCRNS